MSTPSVPAILTKQVSEGLEFADVGSYGVNWLIVGEPCTGKTHTLYTARRPIYVHSFDPQGSELPIAHELVRQGLAIINRDCESDDPKRPTAFAKFEKNMMELSRAKAFDHIGTFGIDSLTFMSEAIMNEILRESGRPDTNPQIQDYNRYKQIIQKVLSACCSLPCDFVLVGHLAIERDEITLDTRTQVLATGRKMPPMIPRYFGEFLTTDVIQGKEKPEYRLITQPIKRYMARTRLGSGIFSQYETPDLMYLREKAGFGVPHLHSLLPTKEPNTAAEPPTAKAKI